MAYRHTFVMFFCFVALAAGVGFGPADQAARGLNSALLALGFVPITAVLDWLMSKS